VAWAGSVKILVISGRLRGENNPCNYRPEITGMKHSEVCEGFLGLKKFSLHPSLYKAVRPILCGIGTSYYQCDPIASSAILTFCDESGEKAQSAGAENSNNTRALFPQRVNESFFPPN
jgi:hypothetical protein